MSSFNNITEYYKSFSGTDTLAFILMPGCTPVVIGSLTTISYSMFRNKKPVINIGRTNINGVTRGSRIYAGTMVFTLINQHWLKELQEQIDYIKDFSELKVDELPLFDIMIISANEYGNAVKMYIYGIDFTDEAQTISVEDLFTENVFSFVARDISVFKAINIEKNVTEKSFESNKKLNEFTQRLYVTGSSIITADEIAQREHEIYLSKLVDMQKPQVYELPRDLYLCNSKLMMGNDVSYIQTLLQKFFPEIEVNGVFDQTMDAYIRKYQSIIGEPNIDGVVDSKLFNSLMSNTESPDGYRTGIIVNKNGTYGFKDKSFNSDVYATLAYDEQVTISSVVIDEIDGYEQKWYVTNKGYIPVEDVYSAFDENQLVEFPTIEYGDNSVYAKIIQAALSELYPGDKLNSGIIDDKTVEKIKELQRENGLKATGKVDNETWLLLQTLTGNIRQEITQESINLEFDKMPDKYHVSIDSLLKDLSNFNIIVNTERETTVKASAVAYYPNGSSNIVSKTITVNQGDEISLRDFQPAFIYSSFQGSYPERVEWVVYPYNQTPYKWTLYCDS